MTDIELRELITGLAVAQRETDRQLRETDRHLKETDKQLNQRFKATDKQLKELAQQIGGLGNKFGSFTEGLALPSMEKILRTYFQMKVISPYVKSKWNGQTLELDVLAYSETAVYIVEVKSHLREEGLQQILEILRKFPEAFPEQAHKALYGILTVVHAPEQLQQQVLQQGIYLARINDDQFTLNVPTNFVAKRFDQAREITNDGY